MSMFSIFQRGYLTDLYMEKNAPKGIKKVASILCRDIEMVTGKVPEQVEMLSKTAGRTVIIAGICGESEIMAQLEEKGCLDISRIKGKRECYLLKAVEHPFAEYPQIEQALIILGSDKRGTIYGMFHVSELCGVSPLVFWGDAVPVKREEILLDFEQEIVTKEPSVVYRGFFINDEWPAFGKWCTEHYGEVNAKAYDKIFELLLRLKGNYLWPAMWSSSFWEDGPGLESARLADEYGIIMGTSHHEPLGRAGIEWQNQYKEYGDDNTWSFLTNSEAITEFWRNGLKRCKNFENIITIGMRGEADSLLMSEDTSVEENIEVLKKAIHVQNRLISEEFHKPFQEVPRMIAIYKEVEDFFYGDETCKGLRDYEEIEDAIWLLSDDNYGHLRSLPQPGGRAHRGGYGMYYHFDYHGAPYSYEWLGNVNLVQAWEQLTMAYEYGICRMWIVNVGDIKGNEYPLSFFMNLAYDYGTWGISNKSSVAQFTNQWISQQFPAASGEQREKIHEILDAYMRLTSQRLPESLDETIYRCEFHEMERIQEEIKEVQKETVFLHQTLPEEMRPAFESMIYYPVLASLNIIELNLAAGNNAELARRGVLAANDEIVRMAEKVALDQSYVEEFHAMEGGKWKHMMDSAHTGFRGWDDNDWTYPSAKTVYPIPRGKITVSFRGNNAYHLGAHWQDSSTLTNEEMLRPDCNKIILDIDSRGNVDFQYTVHCTVPWLSFSSMEGKSCLKKQSRISLEIICDKEQLSDEQAARIRLDFQFDNGAKTWSEVKVKAGGLFSIQDKNIFIENEGYICMEAKHFQRKKDVNGNGWQVIPRLGRTSDAIKSFPVTKNWEMEKDRPYVEYCFQAKYEGGYLLCFYIAPRNPMIKRGTMRGSFCINDGEIRWFDAVDSEYFAEWQNETWSYGVTNHVRIVKEEVILKKGVNTLKFYAADPNIVLENIVMFREDRPMRVTHLAPPESWF